IFTFQAAYSGSIDVIVKTPSAGQLYVRLEVSDNVSHVKRFVKSRLGIEENDQLLIDLYSDKPVGADVELQQCGNGRFCSFYVATDRQCLREADLEDQEHKLMYCLVTGSEKLSTLLSIARENIRTEPIIDLSTNTNKCILELDWCKGETHMRTIIRLESESEIMDARQMRGALIHVNTVFQRVKQHVTTLNTDLRLINLISEKARLCSEMIGKCNEDIERLRTKAAEVDKLHIHQKLYAKELQQKVQIMFDNASSCRNEGDRVASEKVMSVRKETEGFLLKLIETIQNHAENIVTTKSLLAGATTNENMNFRRERQSTNANTVIKNGNDCNKYCRETHGSYERQLSSLQTTLYEVEKRHRKIDEELKSLHQAYNNLRELETRLSNRRAELITISENPLKYLWNVVVTTAAIVLIPFTAGLSLALLGLIGAIDWNNLDSVSNGLKEVRRHQLENEEMRKAINDEMDRLNTERKMLKEKTKQSSENMEKLRTSIGVLPKISSGVGRVNDSVGDVVQTFKGDGRLVDPSPDMDMYISDPGLQYGSAYDAELQVLKTKAANLKSSLENMRTAGKLLDRIQSVFSEKNELLEDITTMYTEVLSMLVDLDNSQHCTDFAPESKNEAGNENDDETSQKEVADDMQTHMDGEEQHDTTTIPPGAEGNSLSTAGSESTEGSDEPQDHVGDDQDDQQKKQRIKEKLNVYINAVLDL
ncbi:hypothetical protein MAR_007773, partial [Mya arenaria]